MCRALSFICLIFPIVALAFVQDNTSAVHVFAKSSLFNYKTGQHLYEGDVQIDQGTAHLTADRITTQLNREHRIEEAIAYGMSKPAVYTTVPKKGDLVFHASAKIIKFYPLKHTIVLEGDVAISQGENSFHGPVIIYNMQDQIITAPASKNGRAIIVIQPNQLKS